MNVGRKIHILLLIVACAAPAFFAAPAAHAQFVGDADISVSLTPENPGAFEDATITLSSFAADLDLASIRWSVGGTTVLSGTGRKSYSFKTGAIGQASVIEATIDISGTPTITKRITVTPLEADLLWEAVDSYVPPFYKGKALLSSEGLVKIVAIPNIRNANGTLLKSGDFSYAWTRNYNADASGSGFAKNSYVFRHNYLNDQERVTVTMSSQSGDYRATENLALVATAPNVIVYENDPRRGVRYERAIRSDSYFLIPSSGTSFLAAPYYFSPKDAVSPDLTYAWTVNGSDVTVPGAKNVFSVRPEQSGTAQIKVTVENLRKLFQAASRTLSVSLQSND